MVLKKPYTQIVLGVLIILVLVSSVAISSPRITATIIGIPSACKSKIALEAPKTMDIYAGTTEEVPVKVKSILCGVSYVRLELNGISKDLYTVGPTYHPVLAPGKEGNFSIFFDIPGGTEEKTYAGLYTIRTNEGKFILGELNLNVLTPEKPKSEVESVSVVKEEVVIKGIDRTLWYGIGFLASILGIILISVEYFAVTKKHARLSALKRAEGEIYKALGVKPKKKEEFEKALRKGKKKG
ncbi:TPA: hypothetical protein H1016_03365 [archaeon]|uniref:Uncharacterized protein n=1 Tax=Candidatus Naiadarchaeum limnaeum TaxID=2756139 RepID=A0A832V1R3_9ARCH|nr:hypothetical protein [Candidatus Naiadarchaeum limnaeum]